MTNKINNLIAEKVMGWEWDEDKFGSGWRNRETGLFEYRKGCFFPSSKYGIESAWKVVERLEGKGDVTIAKDLESSKWEVEVYTYNEKGIFDRYYTEHGLVQVAICLVALKTVGIELEGE